ncbi:accessory Sec system translocase SecA2, partial [Streptococcus danieliae]|nr:accessory Sec system translocase SecA2 [Streptococcus danieliae]
MKEKGFLLNRLKLREIGRIVDQINGLKEEMARLSNEELAALTPAFRQRLAAGESLDDLLIEAYAAIREASRRVLGLFPFDVQVMGA